MSILLYSKQICCTYKISTNTYPKGKKHLQSLLAMLMFLFASLEIVNVHYCFGVDYQDESKDILNSILKDEVMSDSNSEESKE